MECVAVEGRRTGSVAARWGVYPMYNPGGIRWRVGEVWSSVCDIGAQPCLRGAAVPLWAYTTAAGGRRERQALVA